MCLGKSNADVAAQFPLPSRRAKACADRRRRERMSIIKIKEKGAAWHAKQSSGNAIQGWLQNLLGWIRSNWVGLGWSGLGWVACGLEYASWQAGRGRLLLFPKSLKDVNWDCKIVVSRQKLGGCTTRIGGGGLVARVVPVVVVVGQQQQCSIREGDDCPTVGRFPAQKAIAHINCEGIFYTISRTFRCSCAKRCKKSKIKIIISSVQDRSVAVACAGVLMFGLDCSALPGVGNSDTKIYLNRLKICIKQAAPQLRQLHQEIKKSTIQQINKSATRQRQRQEVLFCVLVDWLAASRPTDGGVRYE